MKLENIGFYTLSDYRAKNTSMHSPLWRCELILTDKCNFNCIYCRGPKKGFEGEILYKEAINILDWCINNKLKNIRFSGGEPTLYPQLDDLIKYCKNKIEKIAISTNGSSSFEYYKYLIDCGINDISISLDACCSSDGKKICGGIKGGWEIVVENIKKLSILTYVTVGIVFTRDSLYQLKNTIEFALSLGVSDIRIISAAQYNNKKINLNKPNIGQYPILNYRISNYNNNKNVRGIQKADSNKCFLVLDDITINKNYHFPCIIYMREYGNAIGKLNQNIRQERFNWFKSHNTYDDPICKQNCLDVC
ncbi:hypothetical protein LCGC14_2934940, partial [marine sediment metagenome]